ncbi:hypothetical protein CSZ94_02695 [Janthinobacterium sp. ROICE36]|uniref:hypothetical protein n=1 Tax=unclassified Janthinobacterium TaxID=2610881 RepID=UPI000C7F1EE9|nr:MULTISPECIES: hypothetical protein [unclassified Janthinobacterium]PLY46861.1 hypothetical protein CSZ94_02695 [Janthinobacterium sp. ROICE36]
MFKKLGFFLFAMGVSASYAIAGGGSECYSQCDDNLEQCMIKHPTAPGACTKIHQMCYDRCAQD